MLLWKSEVDSESKAKIEAEFLRISDIFTEKFGKKVNVTVSFETNMRSVAGTATRSHISLNKRLFDKNPAHLVEIFVHELCHVMQRDVYGYNPSVKSHGKEWKSLMRMCGYAPERCHSMDVSELKAKRVKFSVSCSCSVYQVGKAIVDRMKKGTRVYSCRKCSGKLKLVEDIKNIA